MTRPCLIGICGGSASGKTELATRLVSLFAPAGAVRLSLDNYYLGEDACPAGIRGNYDHPEALDAPLLCRHLQELREGRSIELPDYDFARHRRMGSIRFHPRPIVIVEGMLLLALEGVAGQMDASVFVTTSEAVRLERRLARDVRERGRSRESVLRQFEETVAPMHEQFVEPCSRRAQCVISGESQPEQVLADCLKALIGLGKAPLQELFSRLRLS